MNRRFSTRVSLSAIALLMAATSSFAQESTSPEHSHKEPASASVSADEAGEHKAGMHMHKSDIVHRSDKEIASEYKTEAQQLRKQAESHRKLAELYKTRTPVKGTGNYASVAQHCEKLAKFYEDAAKEAEGVATELAK